MAATHRQAIEAILAEARADHAALLEQLSPALRASLPVDASGITRAIDSLGRVVGLAERLREEQTRGHHANPAVLHGRVFGRTPLPRTTVLAAFAEGARVRESALLQLARAAGGTRLEAAVGELLASHPPGVDADDGVAAEAMLREAYGAQEAAAVRIAAHLDGG